MKHKIGKQRFEDSSKNVHFENAHKGQIMKVALLFTFLFLSLNHLIAYGAFGTTRVKQTPIA